MKPTTLALIASLGLLAAPAFAETSWTWTGPKGGTSTGVTTCSQSGGTTECQSQSTYTNPDGKVFKREANGSGTRFEGERVVTTTGPNGNQTTKTRSWSRD